MVKEKFEDRVDAATRILELAKFERCTLAISALLSILVLIYVVAVLTTSCNCDWKILAGIIGPNGILVFIFGRFHASINRAFKFIDKK